MAQNVGYGVQNNFPIGVPLSNDNNNMGNNNMGNNSMGNNNMGNNMGNNYNKNYNSNQNNRGNNYGQNNYKGNNGTKWNNNTNNPNYQNNIGQQPYHNNQMAQPPTTIITVVNGKTHNSNTTSCRMCSHDSRTYVRTRNGGMVWGMCLLFFCLTGCCCWIPFTIT